MSIPSSAPAPARARAPAPARDRDGGIALVMVLIFTVLLYVLVAELVTSSRMQRLTGENDALLARMRNHQAYTLGQIEEQLEDDVAGGASEEGGLGGLGGTSGAEGGGGLPGGMAAEGGGEEESNNADSSQDAWYEPTAYSDDDLTTYVWVEDENRKFNILSLVSPDQDFAEASRHRFIRLIDHLREDSRFDFGPANGEAMANSITEWLQARGRTEQIPLPPLKSDAEGRQRELTVPLHLDELMMLREINEQVFYDQVVDGKLIPGLESVLTIYTSHKYDPGTPEEQALAAARAGESGQPATPPPSEGGEPQQLEQPIGVGIRININTAPRAVLRCLFPEHEIPDAVIEAILLHRNEEEEEDEEVAEGETALSGSEYFGDLSLGDRPKRKIFTKLEDLEELPEFRNLANPELKQRFYDMTSVKSDVFSVHMASLYKRNEERRIFVLLRTTSILVRLDLNGQPALHPLILLEERKGVRIQPIDFPDEYNALDYQLNLDDLDQFARDERRWNPFFLEFYLPPDRR